MCVACVNLHANLGRAEIKSLLTVRFPDQAGLGLLVNQRGHWIRVPALGRAAYSKTAYISQSGRETQAKGSAGARILPPATLVLPAH